MAFTKFESGRYMLEGTLELPHPKQFFDRSNDKSPIEKLCMAIMFDVMSILSRKKNPNIYRQTYNETVDWIECAKDHGPFSFISVCQVIGWDPDIARIAITQYVQKGNSMMFRRSPVNTGIRQIKVRSRG